MSPLISTTIPMLISPIQVQGLSLSLGSSPSELADSSLGNEGESNVASTPGARVHELRSSVLQDLFALEGSHSLRLHCPGVCTC